MHPSILLSWFHHHLPTTCGETLAKGGQWFSTLMVSPPLSVSWAQLLLRLQGPFQCKWCKPGATYWKVFSASFCAAHSCAARHRSRLLMFFCVFSPAFCHCNKHQDQKQFEEQIVYFCLHFQVTVSHGQKGRSLRLEWKQEPRKKAAQGWWLHTQWAGHSHTN